MIQDMPQDQRPWSEQYRLVSKKWVAEDGAAKLLEEMKTTVQAQRETKLIEDWKLLEDKPLSEAKAERLVKASKEWEEYIRKMCAARTKANLLKAQLEYIRMRHSEVMSKDATARKEMGL